MPEKSTCVNCGTDSEGDKCPICHKDHCIDCAHNWMDEECELNGREISGFSEACDEFCEKGES